MLGFDLICAPAKQINSVLLCTIIDVFFPIVFLKKKKEYIWDPNGLAKSHLLKPIRSPDRKRTHTRWGMSAPWASHATCSEGPPRTAMHCCTGQDPSSSARNLALLCPGCQRGIAICKCQCTAHTQFMFLVAGFVFYPCLNNTLCKRLLSLLHGPSQAALPAQTILDELPAAITVA